MSSSQRLTSADFPAPPIATKLMTFVPPAHEASSRASSASRATKVSPVSGSLAVETRGVFGNSGFARDAPAAGAPPGNGGATGGLPRSAKPANSARRAVSSASPTRSV